MIEPLRADVIYGIRAFRARPATAAAAVLTLAVAVGINLAVFGLIDRALLSPPAHVKDPARVFTIAFERTLPDGQRVVMSTTSYVTYEAVRDGVPAVAVAAAWHPTSTTTAVDGEQVQTEAMLVSGSYFPMLGARPQLGRSILPDDDRPPSGSPVAVLSYAFWRSAFSSDKGVLGRRISIRGVDYTVIGIMPAGFSGHSATRIDVWLPLHAAMGDTPNWDTQPFRNVVEIGVRMRADHGPAAASAQSSAATGHHVILTPIGEPDIAPAARTIAYWLGAVSILLLVVGLANTATLLLVRGAHRRHECSIRTALGATRGRLLSQVTIEATILAVVAVCSALLLAYWFDEVVRQLLLPSITESNGLTLRMLGAAAVAGLFTLVAAVAAGASQIPSLARAEQLTAGRRRGRRASAHKELLVVQTVLAVVLLAGAGLFGRSFRSLASQDFGMEMDGVLLVRFQPGPGFIQGQDQLFASALDRIRALPAVTLATPVGVLPFTGFHVPPISVPGLTETPTINGQLPFLIAATPEFFDILGLHIVHGRRFTAADDSGAPVAIVNETMARTVWPGRSALGQCFRIGFDPSFDPSTAMDPPTPPASAPCREVIGVVRDVRQRSVIPTGSEERLMQYYVPFSQNVSPPASIGTIPSMTGLLLRTTADVETLGSPIRRLVLDGRIDLPFLEVRAYKELLEPQMRPWRIGAALLTLFSALALIVSAVGLYAAFAHSVGERRREMAIRIAMGARPRGVLWMVLREAASIAGTGVVCGCLVVVLAGRWAQSMLYGTTSSDPLVLGPVAALMLIVATLATLVPARSASRADPSALLRAE